jgi:hypothetical protein
VAAAGAAGGGVVDLTNEWVNTRASISRDLFVQLQSIAQTPGADLSDVLTLANLPIRPANPSNPHEPLSTSIVNVGGAPGPAQAAATARAGAFKYAQAFPYTRGFTDDFFWKVSERVSE